MDDVKAVVEGVVNEKLKREFSDAGLRVLRLITRSEILRQRRACKKNGDGEKEGLHNSGTRPCMVERG